MGVFHIALVCQMFAIKKKVLLIQLQITTEFVSFDLNMHEKYSTEHKLNDDNLKNTFDNLSLGER